MRCLFHRRLAEFVRQLAAFSPGARMRRAAAWPSEPRQWPPRRRP